MSDAFAINELTGDKRSIRLMGWCLPKKPLRFAVKQRHKTKWNPGSPVATQQALGPELPPTTINGHWEERYIADSTIDFATLDGTPVKTLQELHDLFIDVCRKGQTVEVGWQAQARRGLLSEFVPEWKRADELEWSMTFAWFGLAEALPGMVGSVQVDTGTLSTDWTDELADLVRKVKAPFDTIQEYADAIDRQVRKVTTAIGEVTAAAEAMVDAVTSPLATVRRVMGVLDTVRHEAVTLKQTVEATVSERIMSPLLPRSISSGATVDEPRRVKMEVWRRTLSAKGRSMAAKAVMDAAELERQLKPIAVAVFKAGADTDYRDVSLKYYETADDWRALALFNEHSTPTPPQGDLIVVPQNQLLRSTNA